MLYSRWSSRSSLSWDWTSGFSRSRVRLRRRDITSRHRHGNTLQGHRSNVEARFGHPIEWVQVLHGPGNTRCAFFQQTRAGSIHILTKRQSIVSLGPSVHTNTLPVSPRADRTSASLDLPGRMRMRAFQRVSVSDLSVGFSVASVASRCRPQERLAICSVPHRWTDLRSDQLALPCRPAKPASAWTVRARDWIGEIDESIRGMTLDSFQLFSESWLDVGLVFAYQTQIRLGTWHEMYNHWFFLRT